VNGVPRGCDSEKCGKSTATAAKAVEQAYTQAERLTLVVRGGDRRVCDVSPLPGRSRRPQHFVDADILDLFGEGVAEDPVAITQKVERGGIPPKRLAQLLCGPLRRRVAAHTRNTHRTWNRTVGTVTAASAGSTPRIEFPRGTRVIRLK